MNMAMQPLERAEAVEYATWFTSLADATRIQIVSMLARCRMPLTVGEIVGASGVWASRLSLTT
jgi:hypothetical protein